ncbi:MAG: M6 family metalloprotease domain-containing protein [Proteobacteria bacterium]|nr:M6 family metalloprotease domain-containing protein [Pseudomonadota bacterium]
MSTAPIAPIPVPFGNETVLLCSFGDEFYSRLETLDGYTVLADFEGGITYACLKDGRFVSTGVSISEPPPPDLQKHLQEDPVNRHEVFEENYSMMRGDDPLSWTLGENDGLLRGRRRSIGTVRGLTIIVEFSDESAAVTPAQVYDLMNKPGYRGCGNFGSVRDYFLTMSSNKLNYRNDVFGPIRLPHPKSYYINTLLFDDALRIAIQQEGINLRNYATQLPNEQYPVVDAINFLYAGESVQAGRLWPHNSWRAMEVNGISTGFFMLTGLGKRASSMRIGTICHENGHMLCRLPDLYDYGERDQDYRKSRGMGMYCLMSYGSQVAYGCVPAPICGYQRKLAGWVDNVVEMKSGHQYELRHGDYNTVHLHHTAISGEYFIVENRSRYGYDTYLSSNGLAVMHCDIFGSNEWQDSTSDKHYQCALLQADGRHDLELNRNYGDATDMFTPRNGVFLNANTVPNSRDWNGADSGLLLRNLNISGTVMSVSTGKPSIPQGAAIEKWPRVEIPDNDANGVSVTLKFPPNTPANTIDVRVEILHSWRGDLTVDLTSPSGKTARLQNGSGGDADNLIAIWSSDFHIAYHPALEGLTGENGGGSWTLKVTDRASRDIGTLEYVRISCS